VANWRSFWDVGFCWYPNSLQLATYYKMRKWNGWNSGRVGPEYCGLGLGLSLICHARAFAGLGACGSLCSKIGIGLGSGPRALPKTYARLGLGLGLGLGPTQHKLKCSMVVNFTRLWSHCLKVFFSIYLSQVGTHNDNAY
jgi:hypothetical protein